jgi:DNA processing protein
MGFLPQTLEGITLPPSLLHLPEPPARLFLHGSLPRGPSVAIVGTRHPTAKALEYAEFLSSWLAARGVVILSGGAKGIDAAAHRGALGASGATVVVAPSSFDRPFPAKHGTLYADIVARGGGYLSRFESDVPAKRHQFLDRNALLVALCDALIVVEAPLRSGARNAANWARRLARPCFVVPSPPWNEHGRGCILELQLGARALGGPEEVLRVLGEQSPPSADAGPPEPASEAEPRQLPAPDDGSLSSRILNAVRGGTRYADELADALDTSLPEVSHALLLLTLSGDVDQGPGGLITITRR